jgi:hypothetical protein
LCAQLAFCKAAIIEKKVGPYSAWKTAVYQLSVHSCAHVLCPPRLLTQGLLIVTSTTPATAKRKEPAVASQSQQEHIAPWPIEDLGLDPTTFEHALLEHHTVTLPKLQRFYTYWRNPLIESHSRPIPGQSIGLPRRHRFPRHPEAQPREMVIENDITWRIGVMIDFLIGQPIKLSPQQATPNRQRDIERELSQIIEDSGGLPMLQDLALLGHVHGAVALLLRQHDAEAALRITPIDPTRLVPVIDGQGTLIAAALVDASQGDDAKAPHPFNRIELFTPTAHRIIQRGGDEAGARQYQIILDEPNTLTPGYLPIAAAQHSQQPGAFLGIGEVEPLIPLQDELNTRLTDRAARVTMQSFKMFLAKGIEGFDKLPVGPGTIISTENLQAEVTTFGGDAASPSEDRHIEEVRAAMDKLSGVPPLATGVIQARIGNLSSENALRLTLQGLIARTTRKRMIYGRVIAQMCKLILLALDTQDRFATQPSERQVQVQWPEMLSASTQELLRAVETKQALGVSQETLLRELGYASGDPGVQ